MSSVTFKTTDVEDTFLDSATPTTNHNGDTHLYVGELNVGTEVIRTIIKFPLDNGTIPAGSTINSATLRLYKLTDFTDNDRTASVYRMLRSWVENQATWNVYSTGNSWGTAGADNTTTDREATDIGTRAFTNGEAVNEYAEFSLTPSAVQEMISGGSFTNNGFLIKMATESNDGWEFVSNANATSANHPELVVDYTAPGVSGFYYLST